MAEVWPFPLETLKVELSWLTSVLETFTTEQRAKLRLEYPRATFEVNSLLTQDEAFRARRIAENAKNDYLLPDWRFSVAADGPFDNDNLTIAVDDAYFYPQAGDQVIAWKSPTNYHVTTVATRGAGTLDTSSGPATTMQGFFLLPLLPVLARSSMRFTTRPNNVAYATLKLETKTYKDLASYSPTFPTYEGFSVLTDRDVYLGQRATTVDKVVSYVDGLTGKVSAEELFDHVDQQLFLSAEDWGSESLIKREGWLHARSGRLVPFWKPSWGSDLILTAGASAGATELTAELAADAIDYVGRHYVVDQGGSYQYFEVADAGSDAGGYGSGYGTHYGAAVAGSTVTLTLTAGLTADIDLAAVTTISEMNLARIDADSIRLSYSSGLRGTLGVPLAGLDNDL